MRKPNKIRYLNALQHIESEEIPFFEPGPDPVVVGRILGCETPMCTSVELPADITVAYSKILCNDMILFADVWKLGRKTKKDEYGREQYYDGSIKTPADLRNIQDFDLANFRQRLEALLEAAEGTGMGIVYAPNVVPRITNIAVGYEDYYLAVYQRPEFVHELQKIIREQCLKEMELALSYPIDAVFVGINLCIKTGPILAASFREEFDYPFLREIVETVKSKRLPVGIHSDGDSTQLLPDFIEMGFDYFNPIEPCGSQDIYSIKERWGDRIALHGNIDVAGVLSQGTPDDVARDVIEHMERLAPGGGYIMASSHNITENVPLDNLYAMRDTVCNYRFAGPGGIKR